MTKSPSRGEVWQVDLGKPKGHEQGFQRPALVVSVDEFNHGPAGLAVVLPLTTTHRGIPLHVLLDPPEGGLRQRSYVKCEDIRSVAAERLIQRWGTISGAALREIEDRLRILLGL